MVRVAFYVMNAKGYFVLKSFIEKFGASSVEYVVSSKDKAIQEDFFEEIESLATRKGINFFNKSDNISELESLSNIYRFTIGWRWLIPSQCNLIVFHDSLLPKYRGFSPLVNSLINGEKYIGVTALLASDEYDQGEVVAQKSFEITYPIKINKAISLIQPLYFHLVEQVYIEIGKGVKLNTRRQNTSKATYSLWLDEKDYYVDWLWSAEKIRRFVDAVGYPYDGAKTFLNGEIVNIVDVNVAEDVDIQDRSRHVGKVIFVRGGLPVVICQKGLLQLVDVRDGENNSVYPKFRSRFCS